MTTTIRRSIGVRRPRPVRAALAVFTGSVAVAVGVGLGVPHLMKNDPGLLAATGVVILAVGAVLLLTGSVALVRSLHGWWSRVLAVLVVFALVVVSLVSLGQAVAATSVPRIGVGPDTPGRHGLTAVDASFRTNDGVTLSGWYIPTTNGAAVALLHGAGSTRSAVLDHAAVLARHGYGVLLFDARGHGRSGGRAMDFGWYGDSDLDAAVSYLRTRTGVAADRIGAVGLSMGGEEAIGAAAADSRIRAVVAEGATGRVAADRAWLSNEYGWRGGVQEGLEWLTTTWTALLTSADRPTVLRDAVAATAPRQVLLIAGGANSDEVAADRYIQSASPTNVELWVVPDSGHTAALRTHAEQWEQRVSTFLDAALR